LGERWATGVLEKDATGLRRGRSKVTLQRRGELGGEIDDATMAALRGVDVLGDHGAPDDELTMLDVHVLPIETEKLGAPQTGVKAQEHERVRARDDLRRGVDQSAHRVLLVEGRRAVEQGD